LNRWRIVWGISLFSLTWLGVGILQAQQPLTPMPIPVLHTSAVVRLTVEEARQRVLANSKLLQLAAANVQSKDYATRAMRANYFPKVIGNSIFLHFDSPLGEVLTIRGRTITGLRGRTIAELPSRVVSVDVLNQNSSVTTFSAVQPITDLIKVRQGVKIARAEQEIARAQLEKGTRALLLGAEQLYVGLQAARQIQAGAQVAVAGAEQAARAMPTVEVRTALLEARQALQAAESQVADLEEQFCFLLDLKPCTKIELAPLPTPQPPLSCADEAINLALGASPEVREAEQDIVKAHAAVAAAKADYLPSIGVVGGYARQTAADYIQPDVTYVGVVGSWNLFEWGRRKNTVREREQLIAMATLKMQQTQDDVRKKALKAFREVAQTREVLALAGEMVKLRREFMKKAPPAMQLQGAKDLMLSEVALVKADLDYRIAVANLRSIIGKE
jgi:outer membrane protein TolC